MQLGTWVHGTWIHRRGRGMWIPLVVRVLTLNKWKLSFRLSGYLRKYVIMTSI